MILTFPRAIEFVLAHEGIYSNDTGDPGGETHWGISKRAYPDLNITALTKEDAIKIYRQDYWDKMGCDALPWPMDMIIMDTGVNCGPSRALLWAKTFITPADYLFRRLRHYAGLKGMAIYMRGWIFRVLDLYEATK